MITGYWYPKGSSARELAELILTERSFELRINNTRHLSGAVGDITVSDRVGNIPRKITLADGSLFQTQENDWVDQWLKQNKQARRSSASGLFHRLESSIPLIVFSLFFVVISTGAFITWGLPWASEKIAYALPEGVGEKVGKHTLATLEDIMLAPSELDDATQNEIRARFETTLAPLFNDKQGYELHFRQMQDMPDVANAFALPSGDIVLMDALVETLNSEQVDSVILHEIGHVYHRHGMRRLVHSSSLTVIAASLFGGDFTVSDELLVGFPVFLMHQHYSREAESEADQFAFKHMQTLGIDPIRFAEALAIITDTHVTDEEHTAEIEEKADSHFSDYLSSHPATEARIEEAKRISDALKD